MLRQYLAAAIMLLVGATVAVTGFLIERGHHNLIAGFDPSKVIDADGLGRSIGRGSILLGGGFLAAGGLVLLFPRWTLPLALLLALAAVVATVTSAVVCARHVRRS